MTKRIVIIALLAGLVIVPVAAAQTASGTRGAARHQFARIVRSLQLRVRQGLRSGTLTNAEAQTLRPQAQALRALVREIRQNGARPTAEQRQQVRQEIRSLSQAIYRAKHN
jgi:hypothetical protein